MFGAQRLANGRLAVQIVPADSPARSTNKAFWDAMSRDRAILDAPAGLQTAMTYAQLHAFETQQNQVMAESNGDPRSAHADWTIQRGDGAFEADLSHGSRPFVQLYVLDLSARSQPRWSLLVDQVRAGGVLSPDGLVYAVSVPRQHYGSVGEPLVLYQVATGKWVRLGQHTVNPPSDPQRPRLAWHPWGERILIEGMNGDLTKPAWHELDLRPVLTALSGD